jgi:hypothetical protein
MGSIPKIIKKWTYLHYEYSKAISQYSFKRLKLNFARKFFRFSASAMHSGANANKVNLERNSLNVYESEAYLE